MINLIGRAAPWSHLEMSPWSRNSLSLRPRLETGVSRLQRAKGQVTGRGDKGAEMLDPEAAAAATGGASQDQTRIPLPGRGGRGTHLTLEQRGQKAKQVLTHT